MATFEIGDVLTSQNKHNRHFENFHIVVKFVDKTYISFEIQCAFAIQQIRNYLWYAKRYIPSCLLPMHFDVSLTDYIGVVIRNREDLERLLLQNVISALRYPYLYNLYFITHEQEFKKAITPSGA